MVALPTPVRGIAALMALLSAAVACREPDGGRGLVIVGRSPIVSLDPVTNDDYYAQNLFRNVFDSLVALDDTLRVVPALATSWSSPSDHVWRFELRRGVSFHDGRTLAAGDVKATLDRARASPQSWLAAHFALVSDVRAPSPYLVEIETRVPVPLLLRRLSDVMVLPAGEITGELPVGSGPYRLRSFVAGKEAVLEGFDASWRGRPHWDRAVFRSEPDGAARVERLLRREADLIEAPPLEAAPRIRASAAARLVEREGVQVALLGLDAQARPGNPFGRFEARRAVALSLDRAALVREALGGGGTAASQLAVPGVVGYVPDLAPAPRDIGAARAALAAAGFPRGFDSPLLFSERDRRLAEGVARQAAEAGVAFRLQELPWHVLDARLRARSSPAHVYFATFPSGDAAELLMDLHTPTSDASFGAYNFSGFSDRLLDDLLERADLAMDPRVRIRLLERAQRRATEAHALIPLVVPAQRFAVRRDIAWSGNGLGRIDLQAVREGPLLH
ncbi:MAG TPA: ABC transporter substrate-binding protein [Vicinamibacteria bacterium]|nr:ABC transporter substrate-binding protein [Vicinamibacteria bacterium]